MKKKYEKNNLKFNNYYCDNNYYYDKKVDFSKYINENDKKILEKIGILILDKLYSEYEYSQIEEKLFLCKNTINSGNKMPITEKEYNQLLEKFNKISSEYKF